MKKPCKVCPYRKTSLKGWLGDTYGKPELFLEQLELPDVHPCHSAVDDWDDDQQLEGAVRCTGALQFMNNGGKRSRYKPIEALQAQVGKNEEVFSWRPEFIAHHQL